jgi:intracellular sulfur oxidation DsrE/DsrF family protein
MLKSRRRSSIFPVIIAIMALAAGVLGALQAGRLEAEEGRARAAVDSADWLTGLNGKHRQLFDTPTTNNGIPLVHLLNYYDTYNKAFGVEDKDIDGVLTFYGFTTFHGLTDAMWAKYDLGEFLGEKDASGTPYTANPWRTAPVILGSVLPQASIEAQQQRGATFIICNNALSILGGMVAAKRGLDAQAVYADMKANILPGVTLVPAMVIAIGQAQEAGLTYHRQ